MLVQDLVSLELDPADRHHLARVLRIRPGEPVTATDGNGAWRAAVAPAGWPADGDQLTPMGEVERLARPEPRITVALALTKGDKPEVAVQKLTELGVDRVVLVVGAHSVARWDADKARRNVERLRVVAREALMQSRGVWLPRVDGVLTLAQLLAELPDVVLAEAGGAPPTLAHPSVAIGPEGGWSAEELQAVTGRVGFGGTVLRAETAAVTCATLLTALRAGIVGETRSGQ